MGVMFWVSLTVLFLCLLERADKAYLKWEMKRAARDEPRKAVDPGGEVDPWILTSMWMQE